MYSYCQPAECTFEFPPTIIVFCFLILIILDSWYNWSHLINVDVSQKISNSSSALVVTYYSLPNKRNPTNKRNLEVFFQELINVAHKITTIQTVLSNKRLALGKIQKINTSLETSTLDCSPLNCRKQLQRFFWSDCLDLILYHKTMLSEWKYM